MADEIKIKVGVQSDVKSGMDGVVRDVRSGMNRIRSDSGKGFKEAFQKIVTGDLSGAIEDLQARMDGGMKSITAKAFVWGGGIATAIFAGYKAGQKLDTMFGISDKIAEFFVPKGPTRIDEETQHLRLRRQAEEQRVEEEKKIKKDAAQKDVENQKKIIEEKQAALNELEEDAFQKGERLKDVQEKLAARKGFGGGFRSIAARLVGLKDMSFAEKADDDMRRMTDRSYDRSQKQQEREAARMQRRIELRNEMLSQPEVAGSVSGLKKTGATIKGAFAERTREQIKMALEVEQDRDFATDYERLMGRIARDSNKALHDIKTQTAALKILEQIVKA